jgi:hypothetical protein
MTLEFTNLVANVPDAGAVSPPSAYTCSHALPRTSIVTSWLVAGLSLSEGSPAIQSLLMGFLLLASGIAFDCLKALLPLRADRANRMSLLANRAETS